MTATGTVRVIDFMLTHRDPGPHVIRIVEGIDGEVPMEMALNVRFDYGDLPPWTRWIGNACTMTAVGDAVALHTDVDVTIADHDPRSTFTVCEGDRRTFQLSWYPSHHDVPDPIEPGEALAEAESWWADWAAQITYDGAYPELVRRSLIILKALTYAPSGASVAAITTSLPEVIGGAKNWDYRYAWVRDSTFTTTALLAGGLIDEVRAWRDWVLCALAGRPENMQIMYGITGERRIAEYEISHLSGYEGSQPVRIGNAAYTQFQLGIYGETMDTIYRAHERGVEIDESAWDMIRVLLEHVERVWDLPDSGIWESRATPQHYTHSKVQAWSAFDRATRALEDFGFRGPRDRWRQLADQIHADVCEKAFDKERNAFVQAYGSTALDASVLIIPMVNFLPADDPRMVSTVAAMERELVIDGFLRRTTADPETAAAHAEPEGAFLACNFWLVDNLNMQGRHDEARSLFERVVGIATDTGLISEEYDTKRKRLVGNVPQTLSHAALVNAALRFPKP